MNFYIEITLLPSVEIPLYFVWEKVYQQIHLALVESQDSNGKVSIGVSFPEYDIEKHQLGRKLRLLSSSKDELGNLDINKWLLRLKDYVHVSGIRDIPEVLDGYAFYKRIQTKSSNLRLARRKAKREGISYEDALSFLDKRLEGTSKVPYIQMKSQSSDKRYRLMIGYEKFDKPTDSEGFSTYGLSSICSVPIF